MIMKIMKKTYNSFKTLKTIQPETLNPE